MLGMKLSRLLPISLQEMYLFHESRILVLDVFVFKLVYYSVYSIIYRGT